MTSFWRLGVVGGLAVLCSALSCSGDRMASSDSVGVVNQELSSTQGRVLGFESVAGSGGDWAGTSVKLQSGTPHIEGSKSAAFAVTASSAVITSVPLSSLGPISRQVTLSVWLPAYLAGLSYQGQVGLHLNSPTAGIFSQYYGPVQFTNGSPTGTWQTVTFTLPAADVSALSTRTYNDLVATIDLAFNPNPAFNPSNPFAVPGYVDALSFGTSASGSGGSSGASGSAGNSGGSGATAVGGASGAGGATGRGGGAGASAASNPCVFSAPQASTPNTPFSFTIQLPHGVPRESVALATAGGSLTLNDGVQVVNDAGGFASVSSVSATSRTALGVSAKVQNAYSEPLGIDLRNNAHVFGLLKTAADLSEQTGAAVDGVVSQNATSLKPLDIISWAVSFPTLNRGTCSIDPDNVQIIDPGSYAELAVKSRSHLKLRSGTYYFASLSLEPQAILDIDNTTGPVFIYVKNNFAFSGSVAQVDPGHMNILFGVASANQVAIQSAFRGILVAPQAAVVLPTDMTAGHVGSFFARSLTLHQTTLIHHEPFSPDEFCAAGGACSSFCPCVDGGSCSADDQCRNGHSCSNGQCTCVASCSGKACGEDNGCGVSCPGTCNNGQICNENSECASGSKCTGHAATGATVCEPAGTHCSNQVKDSDESDVDCGGADCAPCPQGKGCSADADCAADEVCGEMNGACFGRARAQRVCWKLACTLDNQATGCGSPDSPCGQNCACVNSCEQCAPGETCAKGHGSEFGAPTDDVCLDPRCPSNEPHLCGTSGSLCGSQCECTANCSAATCQNPNDGCGGICPGVCSNGDICREDVVCQSGGVCIEDAQGVPRCRPGGCAFRLLSPERCAASAATCGFCPVCAPRCDNRQCGLDPNCGQSCGTCAAGAFCDSNGQCANPASDQPLHVPDGNGGERPLPELPASETSTVGALKGAFAVSDEGGAQYSVPIEVPPGRAGMEPALSLNYSGSHLNGDEGVGWHIEGLSKITRCPRFNALDGFAGAVRNDTNDRFCIDGKRLESITGVYGQNGTEYRTLIDSFAKVISYSDDLVGIQVSADRVVSPVSRQAQGPDWFKVWTKNGRILTYGRTQDSLMFGRNGMRYAWLLNRVEDRSGNNILVTYDNLAASSCNALKAGFNNIVHPRTISYTGHGDTAGTRSVQFSYKERPDPQLTFFQGGVPFAADQRLTRITTYVNETPVKSYKLKYGAGSQSQIEAIFECADGDDTPGENDRHCKPRTSFSYVQESGFEATPGFTALDMSSAGQLDANGDGIPDFLATKVVVGDVDANPALAAAQVSTDVAIGVASSYLSPAGYVAVNAIWSLLKGPFWGAFGADPKVEVIRKMRFGTGDRAHPSWYIDTVSGIPCDATKNPSYFLDYDQDGKDDVVTACGFHNGSLYVAHSLASAVAANCASCGKFQAFPSSDAVLKAGIGFIPSAGPHSNSPPQVVPDPIVLDVNGDSLQDVVTCRNQYTLDLWLRQAPAAGAERQPFSQGFATPVTLATDLPVALPPSRPGAQPTYPPRALLDFCGSSRPTYRQFDVDGDGTPDLLAHGRRGWIVLRYEVSGGVPVLSWQPVTFTDVGGSKGSLGGGISLADFNGDGLADIWYTQGDQILVWLNTGGAQFIAKYLARPKPALLVNRRFGYRKTGVLDYNADGYSDLLENWQYMDGDLRYNNNAALMPDSGLNLFSPKNVPEIRAKNAYDVYFDHPIDQTADIDGDGNIDVFNDYGAVFFGRGARNTLLSRVIDGLGNEINVNYDSKAYQHDETCGGISWPEKCLAHVNGLVSSHTEGHGAATERTYTYGYKNARMNVTGHGWLGFDQRTVAMSAAQASATSENVATTTTVDYEPYVRYGLDGKPAPNTSVPYLYPFAGLPRQITVDQHVPSGAAVPPLQNGLYERRTQTRNQWAVKMSTANRPFPVVKVRGVSTYNRPPVTNSTPTAFADSGSLLTECTHELEQDQYGNVTSDTRDCQGTNLYSQRVDTTYQPDESTWLISNPTVVGILAGATVTSGYGATAYTTSRAFRFTYENGLLATAERRATQAEGAATQLRKTTYSRDAYGNVTSVADEVASEPVRTTIISYERDHIFPSTITDAEGQTMQVAFDNKWGAPTDVVDGNGVATQIGYDGFGRTTQTRGAEGTSVSVYSNISGTVGSLLIGAIDPRIQVTTEHQGSAGHHGGRSITEYDSYGRAVRTRTVGFGGKEVIQEQAYDAFGQLIGRTLPHTADVAFLDVPFEKYSYDYLQRLTRAAHSLGGGYATSSFKEYQYASSASLDMGAHGQWLNGMTCPSDSPRNKCAVEFQLTSDELGHQNVVVTDYLGRVVRNIDGENVDNALHSSNYGYGTWGQLVTALDNNGSRTQLRYDSYGRLTSRTDPDTSPGVYTYTYNGFDELTTSTDPKNQLRTYAHDSMGRLTSILDATDVTQWIYQQGRLTDTFSPGTSEYAGGQHVHYSYEPASSQQNRGFLESITYTLDGKDYPIHFKYDDFGRNERVEYPDLGTGQKIIAQSLYDTSSGDLIGLDEVGGSSPKALWRVTQAFQGHLIQQETFGSGANVARSTYSYDPQRRWLDSMQTTLGTEQIQAIEYTHYANSLVQTVTAKGLAPVEYQYDPLNRLRFANSIPGHAASVSTPYSYDAIGNLTGRGATVITPRATQPHLIGSVGSNVYDYDPNGNVAARTGPDIPGGAQTFTYTPFDLPKTISTPTGNAAFATARFEYSADEERVVRRDADSVRHFAADLYQRKLDASDTTLEERFRLYAGRRQIGEIVRKDNTDQTLFFHTDHLGSPDTISDSNGASYHRGFDPFGLPLDPLSPEITRVGFTGQDHDNDLGLIDMKGRIYDPLAGRFTTPDPITQAPFWSQGLNRYSYVFNNPVNNTDPSGFLANGGDSTATIMGWGGGVVGLAAAQGFSAGAVGSIGSTFLSGAGSGLLGGGANVAVSLLTGGYGGGSKGGSYDVPTAGAPKGNGVSNLSPVARASGGPSELARPVQIKGGISELARPSLFDPARGALAQNFQPGGYCHEDGPCHDFIPVMPLGMVGDLLAEIANGIDTITKWWRSAGSAKGAPKPTPKFEPPTNPPQAPPSQIPEGWRVREMPATKQYPNGYWKLEKPMKDGSWQPIDPSTMKPGTRPQTHVPFPPKP